MVDVEYVLRAINGDDEAFLTVIHMYKEALYKTALIYLRNEEEAVEALQEVTFRAYNKMKELREPKYVKTWLIRIMINYCQDQLKRQKRLILSDELLQKEGTTEKYDYIELEEAMAKLDDTPRELITLKYFHDLKIKEIASLWDCPEGTIKTWSHKALRALRHELEGEEEKRHV